MYAAGMQALLHVATWTRLQRAYRRIFNIGEIETNPVLQWILGASTFFFLLTFDVWINSASVLSKAGNGICWPYAQGCESLFFLERLPLGYSQSTFYMALYAVLILIVWRMWRKDWTGAHMLLLPLFLFKFVTVMALAFSEAAPYHYYHLILTVGYDEVRFDMDTGQLLYRNEERLAALAGLFCARVYELRYFHASHRGMVPPLAELDSSAPFSGVHDHIPPLLRCPRPVSVSVGLATRTHNSVRPDVPAHIDTLP